VSYTQFAQSNVNIATAFATRQLNSNCSATQQPRKLCD